LKTSGCADEAHADGVTATAFLPYADVSSALGVQVGSTRPRVCRSSAT
jgi:hypothetical protein